MIITDYLMTYCSYCCIRITSSLTVLLLIKNCFMAYCRIADYFVAYCGYSRLTDYSVTYHSYCCITDYFMAYFNYC